MKLTTPLTAFRQFHPIVRILILGTMLARIASSMSLPFLAVYLGKQTHMSPTAIGFVIGAGSLAATLGGFIGGALSDRIGRRVIMMTGLYMWTVVFVGFALSASPALFVLLNILNGLCRSFYEPVSQALMADLTEPDKRLRMFSLRYTANNIGVSIGPLLGALFALQSAALPFLLTGLVYGIYSVVLHVLLERSGIQAAEGERKESRSLGEAWQVVRKDAVFKFYMAGAILVAIGYSQMTVTLSQVAERRFADGIQLFSYLMSANAITVVLLQVPLSRLMERRSPLFSIAAGCALYAAGDIGFGLSGGALALIGSMVIFTLGEILTFPAGNLLVDRIAPPGLRGAYFGAQTFSNLGQFVGPWLGGMLLTAYGGETMFVVMAAITLAAVLFYRLGFSRSVRIAREKKADLNI